MPIHGEIRHLIANAALARSTGVAEENVIVTEDGGVVDLDDGVPHLVGKVDASYIFVDGAGVGEVTEDSLTDRKLLGEEGFISVVAGVNTRESSVISGPAIQARGFAEGEESYDKIRKQIVSELEKAMNDGVDDPHRLQQVVRRTIGRWVSKTYRRRPMIVPVVIAV